MRSTSTVVWAAAVGLFSQQASAYVYNTLTYEGCFSSAGDLVYNQTWTYNSKGYCQTRCVPANQIVQATTNSTDCWCGAAVPPSSDKVSDSFCNDGCSGYGKEMCMSWPVFFLSDEC